MQTKISVSADELMKFDKFYLVEKILDLQTRLGGCEARAYRKPEAARKMGISVSALNKWIAAGKIKANKSDPDKKQSIVMIPSQEVERFSHVR